MRTVRTSLAVGILAVLCAACGSTTSATTANGNKKTCADFFAYESWVQSATRQLPQSTWLSHQHALERRLQTDGKTARSHDLSNEATLAVEAIGPNEGEKLTNQMNAADVTCANLDYLPPGASITKS